MEGDIVLFGDRALKDEADNYKWVRHPPAEAYLTRPPVSPAVVHLTRPLGAASPSNHTSRCRQLWSIYPATFTFRPNVEPGVEGAFLPADPRALLDAGDFSPVPWITGVNHDEGGTFASCE